MNCLCSNTSTQMNHLYRVGQHSIGIHGLVHPNTNTQDHNACLCIKQIMTKGLNAQAETLQLLCMWSGTCFGSNKDLLPK